MIFTLFLLDMFWNSKDQTLQISFLCIYKQRIYLVDFQ